MSNNYSINNYSTPYGTNHYTPGGVGSHSISLSGQAHNTHQQISSTAAANASLSQDHIASAQLAGGGTLYYHTHPQQSHASLPQDHIASVQLADGGTLYYHSHLQQMPTVNPSGPSYQSHVTAPATFAVPSHNR